MDIVSCSVPGVNQKEQTVNQNLSNCPLSIMIGPAAYGDLGATKTRKWLSNGVRAALWLTLGARTLVHP